MWKLTDKQEALAAFIFEMTGHKWEGGKHKIPDSVFIDMFKTKSISEMSKELKLPMTTVISKLQEVGVYRRRRRIHIELTDKNIKYINTHTIKESANYFHVNEPYLRFLIGQNNLLYIRCTNAARGRNQEQKKILYNTFIELHKTMTYKEIGIKYNMTPQRVCQIINTKYQGD